MQGIREGFEYYSLIASVFARFVPILQLSLLGKTSGFGLGVKVSQLTREHIVCFFQSLKLVKIHHPIPINSRENLELPVSEIERRGALCSKHFDANCSIHISPMQILRPYFRSAGQAHTHPNQGLTTLCSGDFHHKLPLQLRQNAYIYALNIYRSQRAFFVSGKEHGKFLLTLTKALLSSPRECSYSGRASSTRSPQHSRARSSTTTSSRAEFTPCTECDVPMFISDAQCFHFFYLGAVLSFSYSWASLAVRTAHHTATV